MHHRSGRKGIHHRGLRSRKRKKEGFHGGVSGPQKGPAERGHVKKKPKIVKQFFSTFRAGQKTSQIVKNCQNIFDIFRQFSRGISFPPPFGGPLMVVIFFFPVSIGPQIPTRPSFSRRFGRTAWLTLGWGRGGIQNGPACLLPTMELGVGRRVGCP